MAHSWKETLKTKLLQQYSAKAGEALAKKYLNALPLNYQNDTPIDIALTDIAQLELLGDQDPLEVDLYQTPESLRLRLFQYGQPTALSDILPMLENLDLRTIDERLYEIQINKTLYSITDFTVFYARNPKINVDQIKDLFEEALRHVRYGLCENDGFNKLVLGANMPWRDITILRAYAKYSQQMGFRFSQAYIEKTLTNLPDIAADLVNFFLLKFDPKNTANEKKLNELDNKIQKSLEAVTSLDDDRILRRIHDLIKATLRTNFFQTTQDKTFKTYLSLKLNSNQIPELPLPRPLYETFIYSPAFEGIHLRGAKVARGGIRWSDRREDFRTEILGLMKAQKVKNAVIVPSGAKGGFVLKQPTSEVIPCYKLFISGLLDITDNYTHTGKVIRPPEVVCYDDDDPYLVVAADKGTATFSDIANALSKEYGFWLGDAFASGGSAGYDHKKMGITARGAWESIKRHFRELNVDATTANITVAGIGDMSGDVFGNGALYSSNIKLVCAFDHRHIFIDPDPNPKKSFAERQRLFNLPKSSWEDYNPKLISAGGGVFKRSSKSISISSQMKKILSIEDNSLTPNELIRAILKAPVDLLFNGGIGTYVKSSIESHAEVGDKANEFCRVNGGELRCKVVGEGGNLGFTQLGRIEYALNKGLINTDFIDNSAGVDCSDHEVNIKILLNKEVEKGHLTEKQRNALLVKMTDQVAALVLKDNYNQALILSYAAVGNIKEFSVYQNYIRDLEALGVIDRAVEFLPDDKKLLERKAASQDITRPEMAVLLAYTKIFIKNEILKSDLTEDPFLSHLLETAFPVELKKKYYKAMLEHRLRREIIATQLSNGIVNEMGITFVYRISNETGASVADIIRAYTIASHIFRANELQATIDALDFKIPIQLQYELMQHVRHLLTLSTRWFLRNDRMKAGIATVIKNFSAKLDKLAQAVPQLMVGYTKQYMEKVTDEFINAGIPKESALRIAATRALYTTLNIIEVSTKHHLELVKAANVYFNVGGHFNLVWFRDQIANDAREGYWNTLARLSLRDELDLLQKTLTVAVMQSNLKESDTLKLISLWANQHPHIHDRWGKILELLHAHPNIEYSMFFIALREFSGMVNLSCEVV